MKKVLCALALLVACRVDAAWLNLSAASANYPSGGVGATLVDQANGGGQHPWYGPRFSGSATNTVYWIIPALPQDFNLSVGTLTCTLRLINGTASGSNDLSFKITACAFPETATGVSQNACTDASTSSTTSVTAVSTSVFNASLSSMAIYNEAAAANCTTGQSNTCVGKPFKIELTRRGAVDSNTSTVGLLGMSCEY